VIARLAISLCGVIDTTLSGFGAATGLPLPVLPTGVGPALE
jgi:hypothetical protein